MRAMGASSSSWRPMTQNTLPLSSIPWRPARPAICMKSRVLSQSKLTPSYFRSALNTTVRAGMLIPSAKVSVVNRSFRSPAVNMRSTTSLKIGSIPAWW